MLYIANKNREPIFFKFRKLVRYLNNPTKFQLVFWTYINILDSTESFFSQIYHDKVKRTSTYNYVTLYIIVQTNVIINY